MAIYGRTGDRVTIQRLATIEDVKPLDNRKPDKQDRERIADDCMVVVTNERGTLRLYDISFLRADDGSKEISAVVQACKLNGGRAP